ncbi:unnamed protein product [Rotaria sordida]|nr:unnamed protein product [Rotaria sordida]CAF0992084.1 unnamed protein product [Rotaria sordida]CAF1100038.1 unnamed protein product [Rotaria sordida]CAF3747647.1 unnamed protein product [Rotaria sordida]
MPATTTATPVILQETQQNPLQASTRFYMLQSAPIIPAVPILNTTYIYPRYGFVPKPVETSVTKDEIEKLQSTQILEVTQPVQHVIHHHVQPCTVKTCPGYCELCYPWTEHSTHQHIQTRSTSPKPHEHQRQSRRDEFERDELDQTYPSKHETIDEKIQRIRRELRDSSSQTRNQSPPIIEHHIHHRPRSTSRSRSASATRQPWRSSNQNDYTWRDAHLPAYREATLARSQTPVDESRTWKETAHERSHQNTQNSTTYHSKKDFIYRPKSESETRKWYVQSTGKDPDREVHQALRGGTTSYKYNGSSPSYYDKHQSKTYDHSFYSDVPTTTTSKTHTLKKIDSTQHHNLYACNEPCLHVVPKHGSTSDPPYMKILNAPVTYLH